MSRILEGLDGVVCQMDDALVFGHTQEGHDHHLQDTLSHIAAAGLTLNKEKCVFSKPTMKFLGHIISKNGISPDLDKTAAIQNMPPPESPSDLRRVMIMIMQLGKFSSNLVQISCHYGSYWEPRRLGDGVNHRRKPLLVLRWN